jgi:hypothetical protein
MFNICLWIFSINAAGVLAEDIAPNARRIGRVVTVPQGDDIPQGDGIRAATIGRGVQRQIIKKGITMAGKYTPLENYLSDLPANQKEITFTFGQIEGILKFERDLIITCSSEFFTKNINPRKNRVLY